jgi:predicted phosphodiesterase
VKIGLISDTHAPSEGPVPPPQVAEAFAGVDLILHAGDIYTSECLDWLEGIAPVLGVELAPAPVVGDPRVEFKRVVNLEGYAIGMIHDLTLNGFGGELVPGAIAARFPAHLSLSSIVEELFGQPVNIVVFGHTHTAVSEVHGDILFVNPGSATLPNHTRRLGTVAILELTPEGPTAEVIQMVASPA